MTAEPDQWTVARPLAPLRKAPAAQAPLLTEALLGETVRVTGAASDGWRAVILEDGYPGYLPAEALAPVGSAPTHRIAVPKTFLYPAPDIKQPPLLPLYLNGRVSVAAATAADSADPAERFQPLAGGGFVLRSALAPLADRAEDPVAVAEAFLGAPYLWGGKSYEGLDCSGLVQLSLHASGIASPRDSHMIEAAVGMPLENARDLRLARGDLVFWRGHIAMMTDPVNMIHANAYHMRVVIEPLAVAVARIAAAGAEVSGYRRTVRNKRYITGEQRLAERF